MGRGRRAVDLVGGEEAERATVCRLEQKAARVAACAPSDEAERRNRLRRRNDGLPVVLAGPVVRRVEPAVAWIWLATSIPVTLEGTVHTQAVRERTFARPPPAVGEAIGAGKASSVALGRRVHVAVVPLRPANAFGEAFPTDEVLLYALRLTAEAPWGFEGEAVFRPSELCLPHFPLPSFAVPGPERGAVRLLHASCRKLHGVGEDATPRNLQVLRAHAQSGTERPTALLLTGDQIYADDVDAGLIDAIAILGRRLHGRRELCLGGEPLPQRLAYPSPRGGFGGAHGSWAMRGGAPRERPAAGRPGSLVPSSGRGEVAKAHGFTSGHGDHHLFGLGEFAATYALSWSPEVWERFGGDRLAPCNRELRELLANVPTYMMFDDHEVTDDWNLTHEWRETVRKSPVTRRVVANGLAAFWGFQWCGNDPGRDGSLRAAVTGYARETPVEAEGYEATLWGFDGWNFVAATRPPAVFLDTRTHRALEPGRLAGLMGHRELVELGRRIEALPGPRDEPVIVVSPAPVLGVKLWERIHEIAPLPGIDPEDWSGDRDAFFGLLDALAASGRTRFVLISGDVHFAYVAAATYDRFDERSYRAERIALVQLTSSASKNEHGATILSALEAITSDRMEVRERGGRAFGPATTRGARRDDPVRRTLHWRFLPDDSGALILGENNVAEVELDLDPTGGSVSQRLMLANGSSRRVRVSWPDVLNGP